MEALEKELDQISRKSDFLIDKLDDTAEVDFIVVDVSNSLRRWRTDLIKWRQELIRAEKTKEKQEKSLSEDMKSLVSKGEQPSSPMWSFKFPCLYGAHKSFNPEAAGDYVSFEDSFTDQE